MDPDTLHCRLILTDIFLIHKITMNNDYYSFSPTMHGLSSSLLYLLPSNHLQDSYSQLFQLFMPIYIIFKTLFIWFRQLCVIMCGWYMCLHVLMNACGVQRSTSNIFPQEKRTLFLDQDSHWDLRSADSATHPVSPRHRPVSTFSTAHATMCGFSHRLCALDSHPLIYITST